MVAWGMLSFFCVFFAVFTSKFLTGESSGLECFPGDINLAIFAPLKMDCSGQSTKYYLRYIAIHEKMKQINRDSRLIFARENITLGYVLTESCWILPEATRRASQLRPSWWTPIGKDEFCQTRDETMRANIYYIAGVVGSDASAPTEVISHTLQVNKIWQISSTASSDLLADRNKHPYLYRMVPPDSYQSEVIVDVLIQFNWTYVLVLFDDNSYGRNLVKSFYKIVRDKKFKVCVAFEAPLQGYEENYDVKLLEQINDFPKARIIVYFGSFSSNLLNLLQGSGRKFLSSDWNSGFPSDVSDDFHGSLLINFQFGHVPGIIEQYNNYTYNFISKQSIVDRKYWEELHKCCFTEESPGCTNCSAYPSMEPKLTGQYTTTFDKTLQSVDIFAQVINEILENECRDILTLNRSNIYQCITSELIGEKLKTSEFVVANSKVRFDTKGTIVPFYDIKQHRTSPNEMDALKRQVISVGNWSVSDNLKMNFPILIWDSNSNITTPVSQCSEPCTKGEVKVEISACCWECRKCRDDEIVVNSSKCFSCPPHMWPNKDTLESCDMIPKSFVKFGSTQYVAMTSAGGVGILLTAAMIIFYFVYRKDKLLKASALMLSAICLTGLLVSFASVIFFGGRPNRTLCTIRNLVYNLSMTTSYSSLFVKTNRIYRVFAASRKGTMRPKFVTNKWIAIFTAALMSIQITLIVLVSFIFPMEPRVNMPHPYEPYVETTCPSSTNLAFWLPFGFNLLLIFGCSLLAFLTRSLPDNFHDAKCIFASAAANGFLWTAFVPSLTSSSSGAAEDLLISLALVVSSAMLLCTVFLPKVYGVCFAQNAQINFYNTTNTTSAAPNN